MDVDNMVVTTTKNKIKSTKSTTLTQYFINYIYYWVGAYFNYIMENTKDEWTSGYNCTKMNKGWSNISRSLICDKDVSFFYVEVQEKKHHELNGVFEKNDFNTKIVGYLKTKVGSMSGHRVSSWHLRFLNITFCVSCVFCNMSEGSAIERNCK
jgi:uncharacterized membrane protein